MFGLIVFIIFRAIGVLFDEPFWPKSKKKQLYRQYLDTLPYYKRDYGHYSEIAMMDFRTVSSFMQINLDKWKHMRLNDSNILVYIHNDGRGTAIKFSYRDYKKYLTFLKQERKNVLLQAKNNEKQRENKAARDILNDVQQDINKLRERSEYEIKKSIDTMKYTIERM